jgi:sigma-B regulation protein RsbU (phosphoserine phosphatase)
MSLSTVDRLSMLWRISQLFNSTLDLKEVLNLVIDEVIAALQAERGIVLLYDPDGQLQIRVARGLDQQTIESPEFVFSRSVVERVGREGTPQLTSDAQDERWLKGRESVVSLGLRSVLCVPLQIKGATVGVIYVDNRLQIGVFMPADLEILTTIASSAATAIENARLYQIAVEKGRLEQEMQMARELQANFIPQHVPEIPGWEIAASWQPAQAVSGDYYDFLTLDADKLGLVIADVSDKGMPAALFMTLTRTIVRASMEVASQPAAGIAQANRLICADAVNGMFVTLCYLQLDPATGELVYVNGGHNPPWHYRETDEQPVPLTRTGILLGVDDTAAYEQRRIHLEPGDFAVLWTDGLSDALNSEGQEFGEQRMHQVLQLQRQASAHELLDALTAAVGDFVGDTPSFDDITLVVVKRLHEPDA